MGTKESTVAYTMKYTGLTQGFNVVKRLLKNFHTLQEKHWYDQPYDN